MMNNIQRGNLLPPRPVKRISYHRFSQLTTSAPELSLSKADLFFKRCFDVVVSVLAIILILSWLLPILALLIKLTSRGPVFFIQKRVGAMGKVFHCLKLRTMVVNADANTTQARYDDPRITPLGKFLRLSCMDELPQFFNVLVGHMSVVGPRPHMITDDREFSKLIRDYNTRSFVKPGITGMAQVKGCRGKTSSFFDVSHRYKWDMFYVRNLSFHLDMCIMRLTVTSTLNAVFKNFFLKKKKQPEDRLEFLFETPEYLN